MDYFDYFERMKNALLKDSVIVIAGCGQYNTDEIIRVLREQEAKVIYIADTATNSSGDYISSFLSEKDIHAIIEHISSKYGKIDVLITNFFCGKVASFEETSFSDMQSMWENNVKKAFLLCSQTALYMKRQGHGKIIQLVSASGKRSYLGTGIAECATAADVIGMTKGYAEQLAPYNVTANCIAPGLIDCEEAVAGKSLDEIQQALPMKWQPSQKIGTHRDIGYAVVFLASYFANYITGYTMDVNGGFYMD